MDTIIEKAKIDYYLKICQMIVDAKDRSIQILQEQTMNTVSLIEKSAKNLKDPNPLSSAMANINTKFPLSIDKQKARAYHVPNRYTYDSTVKGDLDDMHYHGRVLCKKEAIDWWITEADIPNEDNINVINVLYSRSKSEVSYYYNLNWKDAAISWGSCNLERRRVQTKPVIIELSNDDRSKMISEVFFRDRLISYHNSIPQRVEEFKSKFLDNKESKLSLLADIRLINEQTNPQYKYLPIPAGTQGKIAVLQHALTHSNYQIINLQTQDLIKSTLYSRAVSEFSLILYQESKKLNFTIEDINDIIKDTYFLGDNIMTLLKDEALTEDKNIRWLKAACELEVQMVDSRDDMLTMPRSGHHVVAKTIYNLSNARATLYEGKEIVDFIYKDIRGTFCHNGDWVSDITMNYTTRKDVIDSIIKIASYCRYDFRSTRSKRAKDAFKELERNLSKNVHEFLGCDHYQMGKLNSKTRPPYKVGYLRIVAQSEILDPHKIKVRLDDHLDIITLEGKPVMSLSQSKELKDNIDKSIDCRCSKMWHRESLLKRIEKLIWHYSASFHVLVDKIFKGKFDWMNGIVNRSQYDNRKPLNDFAHGILESINERVGPSRMLICLAYCFIFEGKPKRLNPGYYITHVENQIIDLTGRTGYFHMNQETMQWYTGSRLFLTTETYYREETSENKFALDGFESLGKHTEGLRMIEIRELSRIKDNIEDGEKFNTVLNGDPISVRRNRLFYNLGITSIFARIDERNRYISQDRMYIDVYKKRMLSEDDRNDVANQKKLRIGGIKREMMRHDSVSEEDEDQDLEFNDDDTIDVPDDNNLG